MKYIKFYIVIILFALLSNDINARVRYSEEMKSYIGTWTHVDQLGNVLAYRFYVSDGWLIIKYKYEDHYHDGTEWEGMANKKYDIDYIYDNGQFHFSENYSTAHNSMTLELKEGSLICTNHQTVYDNGRQENNTYVTVFDIDL